jgi:hypothetical protein
MLLFLDRGKIGFPPRISQSIKSKRRRWSWLTRRVSLRSATVWRIFSSCRLCLDHQKCLHTTGCSTQTVASRDRRMDRSHTVGMCKYTAKYSFSIRDISLIFLGRFCGLNFRCSDRLTGTVRERRKWTSARLSHISRWKIWTQGKSP